MVHERSPQRYNTTQENAEIAKQLVLDGQHVIYDWLQHNGHSTRNISMMLALATKGITVFTLRERAQERHHREEEERAEEKHRESERERRRGEEKERERGRKREIT